MTRWGLPSPAGRGAGGEGGLSPFDWYATPFYNWNESDHQMKLTEYFHAMHRRPDRVYITFHWIQRVIDHPISEVVQTDERIRRCQLQKWTEGIRVVLLSGETVHNAFF